MNKPIEVNFVVPLTVIQIAEIADIAAATGKSFNKVAEIILDVGIRIVNHANKLDKEPLACESEGGHAD